MGHCTSKCSHKGRVTRTKLKDIPQDSPLGEMLENWDHNKNLKELDKIRMIHYCIEIWPQKNIQDRPVNLPWHGSKEKWLCLALNKYVNSREVLDEEDTHIEVLPAGTFGISSKFPLHFFFISHLNKRKKPK